MSETEAREAPEPLRLARSELMLVEQIEKQAKELRASVEKGDYYGLKDGAENMGRLGSKVGS